MHLKDLNIYITYRATNTTYSKGSKGSSNLLVKRMQFILPFKISVFIFGVNRHCQKEEYYLCQNHFQLNFIGPVSFSEFKRVLLSLVKCDSGEGNEMLFQCLSTNAGRIQCVLKIVFEFVITQMTQRARYKGPSNRLFCKTNVLGIDF